MCDILRCVVMLMIAFIHILMFACTINKGAKSRRKRICDRMANDKALIRSSMLCIR